MFIPINYYKPNLEHMKLNLRSALPLLMAVALFYSACKKTDNTPATKTQSTDEAGAAIAKNLVQSLAGAYGGASVKDGVSGNTTLTNSASKLKTQSAIGCGFFTDNSLDVKYNQGDSIKSETIGHVTYTFLCSNSKTTGYDLQDSVATAGKGPGYAFIFLVTQDYHVRGLNSNNSNFSLNGNLKSWVDFSYTNKPKSSTFVHNTFRFKDLYIHADDNFDISSGSATFESKGVTTTGVAWDYSGTIAFLGNHKAKLTFLSKVYWVDLITGAVTPV
jgi:hypothetical protein